MRGRFQFAGLLALAVLLAVAEPAWSQRGAGQGRPKQPPKREGQAQGLRPGAPGKGPMRGIPQEWMERLRNASPEDQDRFFQNNQRFQSLPREDQERIRENLRRWNSLSPEQRRAMLRQERIWQEMPMEQRRRFREEILPRWQELPQDRRQAIQRRLRVLAPLGDEEREARLKDERFLAGLSAEDQELLRELSRVRFGAGPDHSEPPPSDPPSL